MKITSLSVLKYLLVLVCGFCIVTPGFAFSLAALFGAESKPSEAIKGHPLQISKVLPPVVLTKQQKLPAKGGVAANINRKQSSIKPATHSNNLAQKAALIEAKASNLNPKVLKLGLIAYSNARDQGLDSKQLLTIIDFSKPSTERRLWVVDLKTNKVLFNTWVSHGKNSGGINASSFSNRRGSLKSSLGVFLTDSPYFGKNGYSLHLKGLEQGFNDNAYERSIVIHGAPYVRASMIQAYGSIGRSWGCPAVSPRLATPLINTIKQKTLLFAYYPDQNWLRHSRFLI